MNVPSLPEAGTGSLAYDSDTAQWSSQEGQKEAGAYTESCSLPLPSQSNVFLLILQSALLSRCSGGTDLGILPT